MKIFYIITILILSVSTYAGEPRIVAHRGASRDAPGNTIPAFKLAWAKGADAIEGDFHLTKDGHIVCIHDKNTKKVANRNLIVSESTLAELRTLDVGLWKDKKFEGTRIPTIAEVFSTIPAQKTIYIEIKCGPEIIPALLEQIDKSGLTPEQILVICFNEKMLKQLKEKSPTLKVSWLCSFKRNKKSGTIKPPLESVLDTLKGIGADGFSSNFGIPEMFVDPIRQQGYDWHVWTVNDQKQANRTNRLGVKSITTDLPALIRGWIKTVDSNVLTHLTFDASGADASAAGISGQSLSNKVFKTDKPLPPSGTVALWYRPTKWYDYQTIFDSTKNKDIWELWINKSAEIGFRTTSEDVRIDYRLHAVAAVDQWQHFAVTWDQETVQLYVNGAAATMAKRKRITPPVGDFCLGGGNAGNTKGKGSWDEVVVLDVVLTPDEVRRIMLDGVDSLMGGSPNLN